jgi:hypothetical protein
MSKGFGKLRVTRPAKRLKPFFWNKVSNPSLESTVWGAIPLDSGFDLSDLEATFIVDNNPASPSKITSPSKQSPTTLLDITRANNIGACFTIAGTSTTHLLFH